jgi:hypothetical protein
MGRRSFLIALNLNLPTDDLTIARHVARAIRVQREAGNPMFAGVRALGFRLESQGKTQVSMNLTQHGAKVRGVAFGGAEWLPHLPAPGQPVHGAFKPKINELRGRRTAEMEIIDWRPDGIDVGVELPLPLSAEPTPS